MTEHTEHNSGIKFRVFENVFQSLAVVGVVLQGLLGLFVSNALKVTFFYVFNGVQIDWLNSNLLILNFTAKLHNKSISQNAVSGA